MRITAFYILFAVLLHPVHVSLTGIEYDDKERVFNIFVKVYSDDMERDMNIGSLSGGRIFPPDDNGIAGWITSRVSLIADGKPLVLEVRNIVADGPGHRITLVARCRRTPETIIVSSSVNTRVYDDQSNMVMFKYRDLEEGFKLTSTDTLRVFNVK